MIPSLHRLATFPAMAAILVSLACAQTPPKSWIDKDTGHRVIRLTDEPGSSGLYFNVNAYTPDGRLMAYNSPDGIHVLDLTTMKTRLLVPNPPVHADAVPGTQAFFRSGIHLIVVGRKTNSVFFSKYDSSTKLNTLYKADMDSGEVATLVTLPPRASVATINADETLGAGVYDETEAGQEHEYGRNLPQTTQTEPGNGSSVARPGGNLVQPENKGQMMERRLAAHIPLVLYTIDLHTGKMTILLHSTDWINHLLFSPGDPALLMYCHEGPWQKVDRIWTIHTDGTHNTLVHHRTMAMEIAGHEFWSPDGRTIWYDWQYPKGQVFFLAGYNLETGKRTAFHMERNEWSIHFNLTQDASLFAGDGGDPGQVARAPDGEWIELFHPQTIPLDGALNTPDFWQPGIFQAEHLVNMAHHNYRLEPNVRFSPDRKLVIFTSNMFGPSYVFAVEVNKASDANAAEIHSTPELAAQFNPIDPTPVNVPAKQNPAEY
jgi:oligogalacturonide lyase